MQKQLVECIPNFSEARRPSVIKAIEEAIIGVQGVKILDHHSDIDHNRTVITFIGPPDAVEEDVYKRQDNIIKPIFCIFKHLINVFISYAVR